MKPLFIISFIIIFLFSFFGMIMATNLTHELSHKQDFKEIASNESVCLLMFEDGAIASYNSNYNKDDVSEYERISKYTEIKAYSTTAVIFIIYLLFVYFSSWKILNEEKKKNILLPKIEVY